MGVLIQTSADRRAASLSASMARNVARRADIGEMPPVVNINRRLDCSNDLLKFGYTYFKYLLPRPPSGILIEYVTRLQTVLTEGGRLGIALPRGYGKSTWAKIGLIWATIYGWGDYLVVFGATQVHANAIIKDILMFIETNEMLAEDFPEVCYPIKCIDGRFQRLIGQTYLGERTRIELGADHLTMPTIPGSRASGSMIVGRGITSGFLGLVRGNKRPKAALLDDVQTRESAPSILQTDNLEKTIQGGVLGLGGHDRPIAILMTCTIIQIGDLSDRYMDPDIHPELLGIRSGLVISWPDKDSSETHWEEYERLWKMDRRNGDESSPLANAYYSNNRIEMDRGSKVEDENLYDHRYEQSALQHAYNLLFTVGPVAFNAEFQNKPLKDARTSYEINIKLVSSRLNGLMRGQVTPECGTIFAFTDVGFDKLRWCVVGFSPLQTAIVLSYGQYPEHGVLVPKNSTEFDQKKLIYNGLTKVHGILDDLRFVDTLGRAHDIKCWGIDRGFLPEAVHYFARNTRSRFSIIPQKGYPASQYRPFGKDVIGVAGTNCHITDSKFGQMLSLNVDPVKEVVQRSFLVEPLSPGSCSFWGNSLTMHIDFAEHICSELLTDKAVGNKGITFWKWSMKPGSKNHLFDTLVGCYGLALWYRVFKNIEMQLHREAVGIMAEIVPRMKKASRDNRVCTVKLED